ncbi:MAG: TonB-dependent receptor, partial [Cyclobacteriaceae bacterium]|nr:TonB-dependent receptor [Cyclobacteriaceae bacterium]
MNQFYKKVLVPILVLAGTTTLLAQTLISGTVKDGSTQAPLAGVNIVAQGTKQGTVTDSNGKYALNVNQSPPFTIVFSFTGFHTEKVVVTENNTANDLTMEEESILGQEVVVSASRMEESIMTSPVTIEKMDLISIKQAATPDYFDALANMKGVQVTSSSLTNTSVNTRGFADVGNTRFVQLIDGIDAADPTIGHAVGSVMAPGELDIESLELIPGAASALYGPNAFNGIMLLKSKSPFDFQGLSAMVKMGITNSKAGGAHPMGTYSLRYAKAFKDKLAFKVNFHYMGATDWTANDIKTDRNNPSSKTDLTGMPDFDGVNLQGDESALVTIPGIGT